MANAVLVVDMLRGFLEEGYPLYIGEGPRRIIPNIRKLLKNEQSRGSKIIYLCDNHDPDDLEFEMFPPHCIAGTEEAEVISELADYEGEVIPKKRYSGFYGTNLEDRLKEIEPEKIIICGVLTNICVMHTTADARNRDYAVEIPVDCVDSPDEAAHNFALEHMDRVLGAKLVEGV
ncbi:MAG: isochorismatase family cysteine hydrolase [Dehalococcoidia bacterium]